MSKVISIAFVVLLAVLMFAPLLVISRPEIEQFQAWFEQLGMESQSLMYAALRLMSYPYHHELHDLLLSIHGIVGSALVVTIGEVLGSGVHLTILDTIVAPLAGLRGKPQLEFIASALREMPVGYSALMQLTALSVFCVFWPGLVLGLIGDSDLMINFAAGTVLGQFINLELKIAVMHSPEWASDFLVQAIIPATRIVTTVLLTYWLWQEQRAVASGGGNLPEAPLTNPAADIPTDVDAADDPEVDDIADVLAGAATAPAGQRGRSAVTSAVKAAAETVRRTGRSAKARVLRFHEAAPSMQDTLKSWTPPQLQTKRGESAVGRDDSTEPGTRRTRRSNAATPRKAGSIAVKKERAEKPEKSAGPGLSLATRSHGRGRSQTSAPMEQEADSMVTGASVGVSHRSTHGPKRNTVEHRLETTLTDRVYYTPGRETRSRKLSQLSPSPSRD